MSLDACADIVRRGDPDRFRAVTAAPVTARRVLLPLYAFNVEVARAPWVTAEPMIAEMRLQWWRDALAEIASGGKVRRHEVVDPLAEVLDPAEAERLDAAVEARRWDIYREAFGDEAALWAHLDATAGTLARASARALGADEASLGAVGEVAVAAGLALWLRAVPDYEARGRLPLPDGRPEAVRALAAAGLDRLAAGRRGLARLPRGARPALYFAWEAGPALSLARREPGRVAAGRLLASDFRRRGALLLTALTGRV